MSAPTEPTLVTLAGKSYPLAFGALARMRYSSILPEQRLNLRYPASEAMQVWACIAINPNPFPTWEHVLGAMEEKDLEAISEALKKALPTAPTEEKKSSSEAGPSLDSASG